MEDDSIFDEDDALDYVLYEEMENQDPPPSSKTGCLGSLIFLLMTGSFFGVGFQLILQVYLS